MEYIKSQTFDALVKGDMKIMTAAFNEYYFIIREAVIKAVPKKPENYTLMDTLIITGQTYEFPEDFNIIDLHTSLVAEIRDSKLYDIVTIEDFQYDELPALNIMGFSIKLNSSKDLNDFLVHFNSFSQTDRIKLADFANRWFDIVKYRTIRYV